MLVNPIDLLKSNDFPSILLLFGEEDFLLEETLNLIINKLVKTEFDKYNFDILDTDENKIERIIELASSFPMMTDSRVIVVKRFDKLFSGRAKKNDSNPFEKYLNNFQATTKLILVADLESAKEISKYADKGKSNPQFAKKLNTLKFPFDKLIENYSWIEFPKLSENKYAEWIIKRFKSKAKTIEPQAADLIASQSRQSLRDLSNEVDKIATYYDSKNDITVDDVHVVIGSTREYNVFELQKSIGDKNIVKALEILHKILSRDSQEMLILAILSKYFISLMKLSDESKVTSNPYQLSQKVGIYSTHLDEYMNAVKKYNPNQLDNAIMELTEVDFRIKSGTMDKLSLMQNMLINIMMS